MNVISLTNNLEGYKNQQGCGIHRRVWRTTALETERLLIDSKQGLETQHFNMGY